MLTIGKTVPGEDARKIFYRVTGVPFNSVPIPRNFHGRTSFDNADFRWNADDFDFDSDLAGASVGGVARGVSLYKSELNTIVDNRAAVAKTDWQMEFRNVSQVRHEARGQLQLPPGAVVSQVMLNVNGKWQQAAVAGRAATRKAYQSVVRRMRDPLLVTTSGPDRILFQCFPVDPGKSMEIRLTITAPLKLNSSSQRLLLPEIIEHNFGLTKHTVTVRATRSATDAPGLKTTQSQNPEDGKLDTVLPFSYTVTVEGTSLNKGTSASFSQSTPLTTQAWSSETKDKFAFYETIKELPSVSAPGKLTIVVDGSQALANKIAELKEALTHLPAASRVTLIRSGDRVETVASDISCNGSAWKTALEDLEKRTYIGGQDAVPALLQAIDQAEGKTAILWVHEAQPIELSNSKALRQALSLKLKQVTLYDFAVVQGPNKVLEALDGLPNVKAVPRARGSIDDLTELFQIWDGQAKCYGQVVERVSPLQPAKEDYRSAVNLAPLWAACEVNKLLEKEDRGTESVASAADREKLSAAMIDAVAVSAAYGIVSRVSGAVVLEKKSDYAENGLEAPVNKAEEVPVRPEPETWLLLSVACIFIMVAFNRGRTSNASRQARRSAL